METTDPGQGEYQLTSSTDPFALFHLWFQEALAAISEPQAMCLSTATPDGKPSNRMVLMKKYSDGGVTFFTNYLSRKGRELEANPHASVLFYWEKIARQIRIEGTVRKLSEEESRQYFDSRPRISQASACASMQSSVVSSRKELEDKHRAVLEKYPEGTPIPKPDNWGGFVLLPSRFEFWYGRPSELDGIFTKNKKTGEWEKDNLLPSC